MISSSSPAKFAELGLSQDLVRAIADVGYTEPTPVQLQAIPVILNGHDVLAGAQTGTGKTAAFTLPLLERLSIHANTSFSPARHPIRALILVPTRELAVQVEESVRVYGKYLALKPTVVYGGVEIEPQLEALRRGVEILVATPGRLLDHVQQRSLNLATVQILVLDEADRMLDMGFLPDLRRILALLPSARQNLLFSATFPAEVRKLADSLLHEPTKIQVTPRNSAAELVRQSVFMVAPDKKRALLSRVLRSRPTGQALVFVNRKQGASQLARALEREGFAVAPIHSDKTQMERMQALSGFKAGKVRVLVATDVAARGLDIEELPIVVNFELPHNAEDYIHRIGRTGRAGTEGDAISLVSHQEERQLAEIERLLKRKIDRDTESAATLANQPETALATEVPTDASHSAASYAALLGSLRSKPAREAYPLSSAPTPQQQRPATQVAALLGGFKKEPKPA